MFKVLIPSVALLGLVAVAAQPATSADETTPVAQEMAWHLSHEGDMAKLAYGVANSDQLAIMMTCAPGDTTATVYGDVQPDSPRLTAASTNAAEVDPMGGGMYETRIALNDPEIRKLAERGRMRVESETGKHRLTADAEEQSKVRDFVAHCSRSQV